MNIGGHDTHPVADIHRLLDDEELEELAGSIKANGLRQPIWRVWVEEDGYAKGIARPLILDGRNRLRACQLARVQPEFANYEGPQDLASLLAFSRDVNEARRHDSIEQRAMSAARAKPLYAQAAKERQGTRTDVAEGATSGTRGPQVPKGSPKATPAPKPAPRRARDEAGDHYGVSGRSVDRAELVLKQAAPEVVAAVDAGKLAVSAAAQLSKLTPEKQRAVLERSNGRSGNVSALVRQVERAEVAARIQAAPLPPLKGPFSVLASDPAWAYETRTEDASHRGVIPYPSMTTDEICMMQPPELTPDAILWLWTTNAFMRDAYDVGAAWGFKPAKTILTWVKDRMGLGNWLRNQTEHCLLFVRGKPPITLTNQTTILRGPVREHSRKPDSFYELVESLCPGPKVEMFAREARKGWARWGAESEKFGGANG